MAAKPGAMTATTPTAPVERVNSKVNTEVVYVVRRGASLREHLLEATAKHHRDVEVGYLRLAPELRFAVEHRQLAFLASLQIALRLFYVDAATAFLTSGLVHVVGVKNHPISGGEFANSAPVDLIEEAVNLVAERVHALEEPAGQGVTIQ